jgi:hypothetical protein
MAQPFSPLALTSPMGGFIINRSINAGLTSTLAQTISPQADAKQERFVGRVLPSGAALNHPGDEGKGTTQEKKKKWLPCRRNRSRHHRGGQHLDCERMRHNNSANLADNKVPEHS